MRKWIKELSNNLEAEYRKMPLFKKVLTLMGVFFFFAAALTLRLLLPHLGKNDEIILYIPHIKGGAYAVMTFGMIIFACCFKKTIYRLFFIFFASLLLFAFIAEAPKLWIRGMPKIFKGILFDFAFFGPPALGFLALRYYLEKKKGLEEHPAEESAWGIKLSPGVKYLFELLNLFTASLYCIIPVIQFSKYIEGSKYKILPIIMMFILMIIIFVLGYYVNTRFIFQGLLVSPCKMKKFLLIVHILFYSLIFLGVFPRILTLASRGYFFLPGLLLSMAGIFIFFMISFLGTYYGSQLAKKKLTAIWNEKMKV